VISNDRIDEDKYSSLDHGIIRNPNVVRRDDISHVDSNNWTMTTNISIVEYQRRHQRRHIICEFQRLRDDEKYQSQDHGIDR
jgi:hypothetical protein